MGAYLYVVIEGRPDRAMAEKLCEYSGVVVARVFGESGKGYIDKRIENFNKAAHNMSWFVLRDLDHDADCPLSLKNRLLKKPAKGMNLCIAVREVEAWVMGDAVKLAEFMRIPAKLVPENPEALEHPKETLVHLAAQSKKTGMKSDIIPTKGSFRNEGILYGSRLSEFISFHWRPEIAAEKCESLRYCIKKLKSLK